MYICPVCNVRNSTRFCSSCGFDESRNYEDYPTFSILPESSRCISPKIPPQTSHLRCSACRGIHFLADTQTAQLICTTCRQAIDIRKVFPVEQEITSHVGQAGRISSASFISSPPLDCQENWLKPPTTVRNTLHEEESALQQMQRAHKYWSSPEPIRSRINSSDTPDQSSVPDWRKSEAAHREWMKSQNEQGN